MTDLSRFDGHTGGPWDVVAEEGFRAEIWVNHLCEANKIDLALMSAAPALLARVKELEEALSDLLKDPTRDTEIQNILEKEWL